MNVFQFFIICKRTNNANNATHYVKLGKKRRESSKRNYYIISPRVIIKAIIIIFNFNSILDGFSTPVTGWCVPQNVFCWGRDGATIRIHIENWFKFSIRTTIFSNLFVSRSDFDSQREPGVFAEPVLDEIWFLFCDRKFGDRLKRLWVVKMSRVTIYRENA